MQLSFLRVFGKINNGSKNFIFFAITITISLKKDSKDKEIRKTKEVSIRNNIKYMDLKVEKIYLDSFLQHL